MGHRVAVRRAADGISTSTQSLVLGRADDAYATLPHRANDESLFADVVTRAFGQRRKTLRNALRMMIEAGELEQLGIEPGARGETLGVPEFVRITNYLAARGR